jgi:hypothetical protein
MAILYFLLGALTVVVLVTVAGVFKMNSDLDRKIRTKISDHIESVMKEIEITRNNLHSDDSYIHNRIDEVLDEINKREEVGIRSGREQFESLQKQLDSRCDKLWAQVNANYELSQMRFNDISNKKNSQTEG